MLLNILSIINVVLTCFWFTSTSFAETNLRECADQSWFKVQEVPMFRFDRCKMFSHTDGGERTPGSKPLF
jgi:hypothetical protein